MTTKLILTHDVTNLGAVGDVVEVKDGYARNYLLPRKLATPWTKGAQRQLDQMAEARRKRSIESLEQAQEARAWLTENVVTVSATAGANGRLFGAVSTADLAEAVKDAGGPAIDRRKIEVVPPIKSTGRHSARCVCTPTSSPPSRSTSSPAGAESAHYSSRVRGGKRLGPCLHGGVGPFVSCPGRRAADCRGDVQSRGRVFAIEG